MPIDHGQGVLKIFVAGGPGERFAPPHAGVPLAAIVIVRGRKRIGHGWVRLEA